jgi:hypothetical protein
MKSGGFERKTMRFSVTVDIAIRNAEEPPTMHEVVEHLSGLARDFEENAALCGEEDDPWMIEEIRYE